VWVVQQQLRIHEWDGNDTASGHAPPARKPGGYKKPGGFKPGGKPPHRR
jgi:ATP-dependent RNA helicase DeaD